MALRASQALYNDVVALSSGVTAQNQVSHLVALGQAGKAILRPVWGQAGTQRPRLPHHAAFCVAFSYSETTSSKTLFPLGCSLHAVLQQRLECQSSAKN